jgi:hypothetical protein
MRLFNLVLVLNHLNAIRLFSCPVPLHSSHHRATCYGQYMSKRLNSTGVVYSFFDMYWFYNSTHLNWTKIPASEHVSNSCDLVAVNNTKHDVADLLDADWLEFMQLGHNCLRQLRGGREQLQAVLGQYMCKRLNSTKPSRSVELSLSDV